MKGKLGIGFTLIVVGIVIVTVFLLLWTITARQTTAETPAGGQPAVFGNPYAVEGNIIYLQTIPEKSVQLRPEDIVPPTQQAIVNDLPTAAVVAQFPLPTDTPIAEVLAQATIAPPETQFITPTPFPTTNVGPIIIENYLVQPGDTLYHLTTIRNTSIELMAAYNIAADNLVAGNTISLPIANPAYCPGIRIYIVRGNDTLFTVANKFGTTVEVIQQRNNLGAADMIRITQVLCIP